MKIERHSPSSLNLFAASPSMFILERIMGRRQPVGSPAHRGSAVEDGITFGLLNPDATLEECTKAATATYDRVAALSADPRRQEYRDTIKAMVERGLEELRPYGIPSRTQGFVEWRPEGLEYPIVGYFDYAWDALGVIVDLKTTEKLPSSIKVDHARQVALYKAVAGDNLEARITYVTPKKQATYRLENARDHLAALERMAGACERFLALSENPEFYVGITCPDLSSFYFSPSSARQAAFEVWGI